MLLQFGVFFITLSMKYQKQPIFNILYTNTHTIFNLNAMSTTITKILKDALTILVMCIFLPANAQSLSKYDLNRPFGWALSTTLNNADTYQVTGGSQGRQITLVSDGNDMRRQIIDAIREYDIIVFDGKGGDFKVSSLMNLENIKNRTIVGINGARLCTMFYCSKEIHDMLNSEGVLNLSTSGGLNDIVLSNGHRVREPREAKIRQLIIDRTSDQQENYREAGIFRFSNMENIIVRNLTFIGPGAIDVGGADLLTISHNTNHVWIDHCEFVDGMDGNFDINSFSDFITVSWCKFRYTERTYIHANTNLIGSNDNPMHNGEDNLNVTLANCIWDKGCDQRMPMVRFGTIHLMNCLYECEGNSAAVNPRKNSEVLIDRCYFGKGVHNIFKQTDAKAYVFKNNIYTEDFKQPKNLNRVNIPYKYKGMSTKEVPSVLRGQYGAGATLTDPLVIAND